MEYKLTPDDLEIGKEYYIKIHMHFEFGKTGVEKYDGRLDGIYTFLNKVDYFVFTNKIDYFEFINIKNKTLRLVYHNNNFNMKYNMVNCDISEVTNEYVLK